VQQKKAESWYRTGNLATSLCTWQCHHIHC